MVAGVGHVFHRGEYWLLIYESCGHDQYFRRTADGLYDLADVEAEILWYPDLAPYGKRPQPNEPAVTN